MTTERPRPKAPAQLPIPNPHDWATLADAERELGVSRQQVWRMVKGRLLKAYTIGQAPRGRMTLFWRAELDELAEARRRTKPAPMDASGLGQP